MLARAQGTACVAAVVPTIGGRAWITSLGHYVLDADDPFPEGFTVGDLWGSTS
jgi:proline racemase